MKRLALLLVALGACGDAGPELPPIISVQNHAAAPQASVIVVRGEDTLYHTTFPAGTASCGFLDEGPAVTITVVRSDTTAVFPSVTLDHAVVRIESTSGAILLQKLTRSTDCF